MEVELGKVWKVLASDDQSFETNRQDGWVWFGVRARYGPKKEAVVEESRKKNGKNFRSGIGNGNL